jgi:hypothetical protein
LTALPVTAVQHDRYSRRARARVYWGHRTSGIIDSLVRKGVQRREAKEIVTGALGEYSLQLLREAGASLALGSVALLIALLFHSPQLLTGGGVDPIDWGNPGLVTLPCLGLALLVTVRAVTRLSSAFFRWF